MPEDVIREDETFVIDETMSEKVNRFKTELSLDADAVQDQMQQADEDMRFLNTIGGMWEGFFESELQNRVKLQFPMIANFLSRVQAEWNGNRVGVEYKPGDDLETSDKDAELMNGIHRADARRRGMGKKAIDNGVLEVMNCGVGAFILGEDFIDNEDPENDLQRIEWRNVFDAYETVFWDEASQPIDKHDARRCHVLKRFTKESFKEKYPDKNPSSAYTPVTADNSFFGNNLTTMRTGVFVATRYEVIKKKESVFVYKNMQNGELETYIKPDHDLVEDELKARKELKFVRERKIIRRHVEKSIFSGEDMLSEPKRIAGEYIPVISIYGHRIFVGGLEWYKGFIRDLKDASRLLNQQLSQLSENASGNGADKPIFDPDQMEGKGIKEIWADPTDKPYFLANALRDADGNPIAGGGPIGQVKPAQLDGSTAALLQLVPQLIKEFTGAIPIEVVDEKTSGKAIQAARKIQDLITQPVMENISAAIEWSGVVYASKASELYTTPRIIRTIGKDGSENTVQMMKVVQDRQTGKIIEANTLEGKKFRAYADIGPQFETQRQETTDTSLQLMETWKDIPSMQPYLPELGAIAIENMAGTGLESIKLLNRRIRLLAGTVEPDGEEEEAFLAQHQQQQEANEDQKRLIQAATQQQLSEARNLDAASIEKIQSAELKAAQKLKTLSDIRVQETKNQSDIRVNQAKTLMEIRKEVFEPLDQIPVS